MLKMTRIPSKLHSIGKTVTFEPCQSDYSFRLSIYLFIYLLNNLLMHTFNYSFLYLRMPQS